VLPYRAIQEGPDKEQGGIIFVNPNLTGSPANQTEKMGELSPNSTVSYYRIFSKLVTGDICEVCLAEDTHLDRKVALRILPAEFIQDVELVRRFTQDAKATSALNHPNMITVYDIGEV